MSDPLHLHAALLRPWRPLLTFLLLASTALCMGQADITVHYVDGSEQSYAIAADGRLQFSGDELLMAVDGAAPTTNIPLSIIRKLTFGDGITTAVEEVPMAQTARLFPNPAEEFFIVAGTSTGPQEVRILTATGQQVLAGIYGPGQLVPVGNLPAGIYIVTIDNVPFKLVKP